MPWSVVPIGGELAYATEDELKNMFADVGSSQLPIEAFQVERKDKPGKAAAIYIVPKDATLAAKS